MNRRNIKSWLLFLILPPVAVTLLFSLVRGDLFTEKSHVGAYICKSCHPLQYDKWSKTPHAKSFDRLPTRLQKDYRCLGCHTSGLSIELRNVQCESCHGGGFHYAKSYVMKDKELSAMVGLKIPTVETCRKCHTPDRMKLKKFSFLRAKKEIDHSRKTLCNQK